MNIEDIIQNIDPSKWEETLMKDVLPSSEDSTTERPIKEWVEYYEGKHPILTATSRSDYQVEKKDDDGNVIGYETVERTRLILQYQKQIVETAAGMMFGEDPSITSDDDQSEAFKEFVEQWRKGAKLDPHTLALAERLYIESKVAEVFYRDEGDVNKDIRVQLISYHNGDEFYPFFNDNGKMGAFTRKFKKDIIKEGEVVEVEVVEIYTAEKLYKKIDDGEYEETKNEYGKIPVVYYDQLKPEFFDVMENINKQEMVKSQNSDVNKRIGNPALVASNVDNFQTPDIDNDVKVYTVNGGVQQADGAVTPANLTYLKNDSAPEAIKMELDDYKEDMYKATWPDLSILANQQGAGVKTATEIKMMFVQATMKIAKKYKLIFGSFDRRVSIMKAMLGSDDLNIDVKLNSVLPTSLDEYMEMLGTAKTDGLISQKDAVSMAPINEGNENAYQNILDEERARRVDPE